MPDESRKNFSPLIAKLKRHAKVSGMVCLFSIIFFSVFSLKFKAAKLHTEINNIHSEINALKDQVEDLPAMREELSALRAVLAKGNSQNPPISNVSFSPDGSHRDDPFLGAKDGAVIIMAFIDYQCGPCRKFYQESFPQLKADFIDNQKATFILRDFPLPSNENSLIAANFAHCAGEQGVYGAAFQLLFEEPAAVDSGDFATLTEKLAEKQSGLNKDRLRSCYTGHKYDKESQADSNEGRQLGAKGAPGFFVGRVGENSSYTGVFIRGAQPYAVIKSEILKALGEEITS